MRPTWIPQAKYHLPYQCTKDLEGRDAMASPADRNTRDAALVVEEITKDFVGLRALDSVSLKLERGEILGLDLTDAEGAEERSRLLSARLEGEQALLLINEVWQAEEATPLMVGGPACRTVIATREELPVSAARPYVAGSVCHGVRQP